MKENRTRKKVNEREIEAPEWNAVHLVKNICMYKFGLKGNSLDILALFRTVPIRIIAQLQLFVNFGSFLILTNYKYSFGLNEWICIYFFILFPLH